MANYLYYDTPPSEYKTHYPNIQFPFKGGKLATQLPKNIAIIRAVATVALTSLVAIYIGATIVSGAVVVAGLAFAGWTLYSHLLAKDSLMEAFYKIAGGKDKFEALPEVTLNLTPDEKLFGTLKNLDWDQLQHPIAKAETLDGRKIIVIKGRNRAENTNAVFAFVERLGPKDMPTPRQIAYVSDRGHSIMHAIFAPYAGNTFGRQGGMSLRTHPGFSTVWEVFSSISSDRANEFIAQVATH